MGYQIRPPTVKNGQVKVVRQGLGMSHTKQKHKASPTRFGTWVWIDGYMERGMTFMSRSAYAPKKPLGPDGEITDDQDEREAYWNRLEKWYKDLPSKFHHGWIDLDSMIYVGWTAEGIYTRSGFFNSGDWNLLTMKDALAGLRKITARGLGYQCTEGGNYSWIDNADIQVYVPKDTKIR